MSKAVHINGVEYTYKVHSRGVKVRWAGGSMFAWMTDLTGWSSDDLERAKWKGCPLPQVTPSLIKQYIIDKQRDK